MAESRLKELLPAMPLLLLRAVPVQPGWQPSAVGYLRGDAAVYDAPVYYTTQRGATFVFLATLRSREPVAKGALAGVALILCED